MKNIDRVLCERFPKGADFSAVTDEGVWKVRDQINLPRKRLGYLAPYEVHYSRAPYLLREFK